MSSIEAPAGSEPRCRVCGSQAIDPLFTTRNTHGRHVVDHADTYRLLECRTCTCRFLDVRVDDAYYAKAYGVEDYFLENGGSNGLAELLSAWSLRRKQRMLLRLATRDWPLDVLDVGCGAGGFLASLDPGRFYASGIDCSEAAVRIASKRGFAVSQRRIEDLDPCDQQYDVITLWHVLEHLPNPVQSLAKLRDCLRSDGRIVMQVPNSDGLGFAFGREHWFHLDSPRHLWLPGRRSMTEACSRAGLRIVRVRNEFHDYPLDLFWSVRQSRTRFLVWPLYPIFKMIAREHLTYECAKA